MGCSNSTAVSEGKSQEQNSKQTDNMMVKQRNTISKTQAVSNDSYTMIDEQARQVVKMDCSNSTAVSEGKSQEQNSKQTDNMMVKQRNTISKTQAVSNDSYALVDKHARQAPPSLKNSIPDLVAYLSKPSKEPRMIARAIFVWISENIAYDTDGYFGRTQWASCDAESVIKGGKSVCEGYANVMELLCREAGIPVKKISGFAKGFGYSAESPFTTARDTNHAWNAIQLENKWFLVDSTWGSGNVSSETHRFQKVFKKFYFLTNPDQLVYSHFPYMKGDMEESLKWQLLKTPVKLDEFNKCVRIEPDAFKLGVEPVSHKEGVISMQNEIELAFKSMDNNDISYSTRLMYKEGNILYEKPRNVFEHIEDGLFKVKIHPHKTGTFQLSIFGSRSDEEGIFSHLMEYIIKCEETTNEAYKYPLAYMQAQVDRCILKQPLQNKLKQNTAVDFHIISPYLNRVMVNKTFLEKSGTSFKGSINTGGKGETLYVYGSRDIDDNLGGLYKFEVV